MSFVPMVRLRQDRTIRSSIKGSFSGPLAPGISAGVAVLHAEHDGFVQDRLDDREYNDKNTFAARGALAINPSPNIRIDLTADYARDDAKLNVGRPVNNLTTFSATTLVVTDPVGSGRYHWKGETTPGLPNTTKMTHYGFAGTAAIDVTDSITLKSITAYRNLKTHDFIDIDATRYSVGDVFVGVRQHQFSQEFQATYTGTRLNAVAGLYYLKERVGSHQEAYADDLFGPLFGNPTFLRTIDDDLTLHSYAAYANASYEVVPDVRLSGGIRFTKEKKDYFRTTTTFLNGAVFNPPFVFAPHDSWKDTSPMASVDWQVTPSTMLYARVAKGFKSGGFNGRANNPSGSESTTYDPETVWSYEAGFKTTIANQLRVNGAVFTSNYKDFQARIADTDTSTFPPTPLLSVLNAGKMRISGAELEAAWTPTKSLLIDGQLGYLNAKYKEFEDARFTNFGGSRAFQTPPSLPNGHFGLALNMPSTWVRPARSPSVGRPATVRARHSPSTIPSSTRIRRSRGCSRMAIGSRTPASSGRIPRKSWRSASMATTSPTRPTRLTPRNSPASVTSAPSITVRRAQSPCV